MRQLSKIRFILEKIPGGIVGILFLVLISFHFNKIEACPGYNHTVESTSVTGQSGALNESSGSSSSSNWTSSSSWSDSSSWSSSSEWNDSTGGNEEHSEHTISNSSHSSSTGQNNASSQNDNQGGSSNPGGTSSQTNSSNQAENSNQSTSQHESSSGGHSEWSSSSSWISQNSSSQHHSSTGSSSSSQSGSSGQSGSIGQNGNSGQSESTGQSSSGGSSSGQSINSGSSDLSGQNENSGGSSSTGQNGSSGQNGNLGESELTDESSNSGSSSSTSLNNSGSSSSSGQNNNSGSSSSTGQNNNSGGSSSSGQSNNSGGSSSIDSNNSGSSSTSVQNNSSGSSSSTGSNNFESSGSTGSNGSGSSSSSGQSNNSGSSSSSDQNNNAGSSTSTGSSGISLGGGGVVGGEIGGLGTGVFEEVEGEVGIVGGEIVSVGTGILEGVEGGVGTVEGETGSVGAGIFEEVEGGAGGGVAFEGGVTLGAAGGILLGHSNGETANQESSPHGNSSLMEIELILSDAELERQIVDMEQFLLAQMEIPGSWNNTDQSTKVNSSTYGVPDLGVFRQIFTGFGENVKRDSVCAACQVYTGVLMHQINRRNESRQNLEHFALFTCRFFRLAHPDVCQGVIQRLSPTFYWIVKQRKKELSPQEFCGVTLQSLGCRISKRKEQNSEFNWEVDPQQYVPAYPPQSVSGSGIIGGEEDRPDPTDNVENFTPLTTRRRDNQPIKILHIADIHIDPDYAVGTDADCENEVLCCQERFGWPNETETGAGYYGDNRRCDAPMKMLHMALKQIQQQHSDIDLIYMTGDLVPHNIWFSTQEENEEIIRVVSRTFLDYFPNTRIVPCLGNHEAHPVNLYSPTSRQFDPPESNPIPQDLRQDWVYETAYEAWKQWIPTGERENFLKAGYFVVELNDKMRAIVVNTNVCYGFNMWQTYDPRDPGDMLRWLQNELYVTQKQGKTAHIVGHVPPGHEDCTKTWSREFYKIIARYKNVVTGQFYGHTHYDEFRILHDPENKTIPINMMWIGPSLTPYRIYNPGYRIYHMDVNETTYGNIIDHETWIYDLDKANDMYRQMYGDNGTHQATPEEDDRYVQWFQSYQATKAYGIPNVLPESMRSLVYRMAKDQPTFDLFHMNYYKATNPDFEEKDCDTVCKKRILCGIVRSYYDDDEGHQECNQIQKEVDGIVLPLRTLDLKRRFIWL